MLFSGTGYFVGVSSAAIRIANRVAELATTRRPVMVLGEVGAGRTTVARAIHTRGRAERPFVVFASEQLSDPNHITTALGSAADGTLVLLEPQSLEPRVQVEVLRACSLASNVRIILVVSKSRDHAEQRGDAHAGSLLNHGIYRRHQVHLIEVPSLRERRADIVPLARFFLAAASRARPLKLSASVERALDAYDWPGNITELRDVVEAGVMATSGDEISLDALPGLTDPLALEALSDELATLPYDRMLSVSMDHVSRMYLSTLLREVDGNVAEAAKRAGVERESFYRLLRRLGIAASEFRPK